MLLVATCFIIWKFIATEGVENARSVHVALETALTFNKKDNSANLKFIDDFQDFLSKVRNTVNDINEDYPSRRNNRAYEPQERNEKDPKTNSKNQKFTEFIKELLEVLRNYNDDDLEDVIAVIDEEIRKYHYKGCKFYELLSDNLRLMVAEKLDLVKDAPVDEIRDNLDETLRIIEESKFDPKLSELLDYIDSLYTRNDERKFQKALGFFNIYQNKYKRSNMDLTSLVRDSIRSVIFDHYSNLNANTRRDFRAKLEKFFWKNVNEKDNVQHLEWTINYDDSTTKSVQSLRQLNSKQPTTAEPKFSNKKGADINQILSNIRNNKNPNKALNLNFVMENQMDIYKTGGIRFNKKKNNTSALLASEDKFVNENEDKTASVRERLEFDLESTEQLKSDSDSKEEGANESDDHDISDQDKNIGQTVNIQDDDGSYNAVDALTDEVDLTTKRKRHKKLKYTTPLSMDAYSAEAERHKKVKGFTSGNIGRSGNNKKYNEMSDSLQYTEIVKPKKKIHKKNHKTTLDSRNRIHTVWEESYVTKKQQKNRETDEAITSSDSNSDDVEKTSKASDDFKSRIHDNKKKYRDIKLRNIKTKYTPKARHVSSEVNDNNKGNIMQDFSFNAQLQNVYPKGGEGLKLKIAALKKNDFSKKALRTKIKTNEKKEKLNDEMSSSKDEIENALNTTNIRGTSSDVSTEKEDSKEFTKRHKTTKKPKSKQHKTIQTSTDETYEMTREEVITTKLPKTVKKLSKIQSSSNPDNLFDKKSIENQNDSSEEELQTATKKTKRPKKSKISLMKQKSLEKYMEESHGSSKEDLQSVIKITKNKNNSYDKTKSTPKQTDTAEKSTKEINESTKKNNQKKHHKRRIESTKRHIHKKIDKVIEKLLDEEHSKSEEEETQIKKLRKDENIKKKSFPKHTTRETYVKPKGDIFISIENKGYPMNRFKIVKAPKNEVTANSFSVDLTSAPTSTEAKFMKKERSSSNAERYKTLSEPDGDEKYSKNTSISPTTTPQMTELSTNDTSTVKTLSTTPEEDQLTSLNLTDSKTGLTNTDIIMRASPEKKSSNASNEKPSLKSKDKTIHKLETAKRVSKSYLQLIDFFENATTVKLNLDSMKPTINEERRPKRLKYTLSDFWKRHSDKVKMKAKHSTDSTSNLPMTITNKTTGTTKTNRKRFEEENNQLRKKKKKRRRKTSAIAIYRRSNAIDNLNNSKPTAEKNATNPKPLDKPPITDKENAPNQTTFNNKITDYYNDNNTDYDKPTGVDEELKDFLDLHDIKLDNKNDTEINLDTVNALIAPEVNFPEKVKHEIVAGLKDGTARRNLERDIIKLFGTPVNDIASTTINTLYTDPLDNINQNMLDLDSK